MTCPSCDGTGRWLIEDGWTASQCPTCGGSGEHRPPTSAKEAAAMAQNDAHEFAPCGHDLGTCTVCGRSPEDHGYVWKDGGLVKAQPAAWDREEALRVAEWFGRFGHDMPRQAAALLRAADAEIARLRAREADAEKAVEALVLFAQPFADALDIEADFMTPPGPLDDGFEVRKLARAALAAWDASREGGR